MLTDRTTVYDWAHGQQSSVLIATCAKCSHRWTIQADDYLRGRNPPYTVGDLKAKLSCPQCNSGDLTFETSVTTR